jgi:putative phage-type endonuclease
MPRLTAEQLAHRRSGMGATDVVEALGLAPWEGAGPMRLFLAKTTDQPDDAAGDNGAELEWGHVLEPVILEWYERETGRKCLPGGHVPHPTEDWLWATLDAKVIGESRIVEIKNVGANLAWHWNAYQEDGIPRYVRAQATIGMLCAGVGLADVVASVGGRAPHVWTVAFDDELAALLLDGARAFWEQVRANRPPPLDATPATKEYLRQRYPSNVDRKMLEADPGTEELAELRIQAALREKEAAQAKAVFDAQLMDRCMTADGIVGDGWKFTWKLDAKGQRRQRFTGPKED